MGRGRREARTVATRMKDDGDADDGDESRNTAAASHLELGLFAVGPHQAAANESAA
jgi:hypothetical protein